MTEIRRRVAVVTGAAAATGRTLAERLGREGAAVVVADVDPVGGLETVRAIETAGGRAAFVRTDMRFDADVEALMDFTLERFGGLHVLVNNAGGGGNIEPHFPEADPAQWTAWLDLNLRAAMLATQLAVGPMQEAGGGAVVNIASSAGLGFTPYVSPEYAAAKAGLIRFTTSLAGLGEQTGVRVNCIVPDWIGTERAKRELAEMSDAERAAAPPQVDPEAIGDALVRLVRDDDLAGRVILMWGGEPARLLDPERPDWERTASGIGGRRRRLE
jgi:NAD(P)-dependent dehydrogenase (short-subunit alcohol dehydrogenase family)